MLKRLTTQGFSCIAGLLALAFPGIPSAVPAQGVDGWTSLHVTVYNVEQGLDQSTVSQVLQDPAGLLWLINGGGLQCFDGREFRSFGNPEELPDPGSGNTIRQAAMSQTGDMILSNGQEILGFSSASGLFTTIVADRQYATLLDVSWKGRPLCWTTADRLCLAGDNGLSVIRLVFSPGQKIPEGFSPVRAVMTGARHYLVAGKQGYLDLEPSGEPGALSMRAKWVPFAVPGSILCPGPDGRLFLLANGIICTLQGNGSLRQYFDTKHKGADFLFIDRHRNFWVCDPGQKWTGRISNGRLSEIRYIASEGKYTDTIRPCVRTLFEDGHGNLWFGTDGLGLLFHASGQQMFDLYRTGFTRSLAWCGNAAWAGTFRNGLWRLPDGPGKAVRINPAGLTNDLYFFDLAPDPAGRLWAATNKGVYLLDRRGTVLQYFPMNTATAKFLNPTGRQMLLSTYDRLFSCETGRNPGVSFIRSQTNIPELVAYEGAYWAGNHFGLFRSDTAAGVLEAMVFKKTSRLSPVRVYSILPHDGFLWTGTDRGIGCYSASGEKQPLPACVNELKNEIIYSLLPGRQGSIWFAGNRGIGCIPASRDRVIRFSQANNLQSAEFNSNARLALPGGRILFGGINGINAFNTDGYRNPLPPPGVRLAALNVADTQYTRGVPARDLGIDLDWRTPSISGSVFTPDYLPAGTVLFSFMLKGYQDQWSKASADPVFSFRNLPPGNYTLLARCSDSYRNTGPEVSLVTIRITPPFWKTTWFFLLSAGILAASAVLILRTIQEARHRREIAAMERRHAIDRERLRISQDMHDEIGANLTHISILSEMAKSRTADPEETRRLIGRIAGIAGTVVDDIGEIIWAMNPVNDNLASFASYLRQHVSEYLSSAGPEGEFRFPDDIPAVSMTSELRRNVYLVVKEAVHNAVKHAGACRVTLTLTYADGLLSVAVEDDGAGFDAAKCGNTGNGLPGMRRRITGLGGTFFIDSRPGEGTRLGFSVAPGGSKTT